MGKKCIEKQEMFIFFINVILVVVRNVCESKVLFTINHCFILCSSSTMNYRLTYSTTLDINVTCRKAKFIWNVGPIMQPQPKFNVYETFSPTFSKSHV